MRFVIAPDSFKECATAVEVAGAIALGVRRACPDAECDLAPMADGGEGTVDALVQATSGEIIELATTGPMGTSVNAYYGILGGGQSAVIEMAAASGLQLVGEDERDPRIATTYGTGELMRDVLERGVRRIIIGIGGSATNDGGAGMAQALGVSLRDKDGNELARGGAALANLAEIDMGERHPALAATEVLVACDVQNPLCGPQGASQVYGPQKGATPDMAEELNLALGHFGSVVEACLGLEIMTLAGGGAAGGLGAGLVAFADARLKPGVDIVADACGLANRIKGADLVITGEGSLDAQTAHGKTPIGVARIAKEHGVPVVAIAGKLGEGYQALYSEGIDAAFSISPGAITQSESISQAHGLITDTAEAVTRLWLAGEHINSR